MNQKGKGEDSMMTPPHLFKQLDSVFNFNFDAACTKENSMCSYGAFYDDGCDGLLVPWKHLRVFCNPPFSDKAAWIKKAAHEVEWGGCPVVVMVLPSLCMDSIAWHEYIENRYRYEVLKGRVSFIDPVTKKPKTGNNSGTVIVYFMKKISSREPKP